MPSKSDKKVGVPQPDTLVHPKVCPNGHCKGKS